MWRSLLPALRVVGLTLLPALSAAAPLRAQTPYRDTTVFWYAYAALRVHEVCRAVPCPGDEARTVAAFVAAPFTATVPTNSTIREAFTSLPVPAGTRAVDGIKLSGSTSALPAGGFGAIAVRGLADFLVIRARAELTQSVIRDVRSAFQRRPDLQRLLPLTFRTVEGMANLSLGSLLPSLRTALMDDLRRMPPRLMDPSLDLWRGGMPARVKIAGRLAVAGYRIAEGGAPLAELAGLAQLDSLLTPAELADSALAPMRAILGTAGRLAGEIATLTRDDASEEWYKSLAGVVGKLSGDRRSALVFTALLLDRNGLPRAETGLDPAVRIVALVSRIRSLSEATGSFQQPATPLDFLNLAAEALALAGDLAPGHRAQLAPLVAMVDAIRLAIAEQDYSQLMTATLAMLPEGEAGERLRKLVTLAGALAAARSSDAVVAGLEAWADPVGSYGARREAGSTRLSIVSYLGAGFGSERVLNAAGPAIDARHAGAFVPVGVELSFGLGPASLGLMGSVVNVGAIANLQTSDDAPAGTTVDDRPETSLRNVFAPGLYLTLGLSRRYPLTIGGGIERAPRLRRVTTAGGTRDEDAIRTTIFAAIDLTLFRLVRF